MIGPHSLWATGPCFYCGRETHRRKTTGFRPDTYTRDHLIPKRLRRASIAGNPPHLCHLLTVTCCLECNLKKGSQTAIKFAALINLAPEKVKHINRVYSMNHD